MKGKVEIRNGLRSTGENEKGQHDNGMMTKEEKEFLVDSAIESIEGERYPSVGNDKQWEEFLIVTNEILVHYYQYLKENGEEI